MDNDEMVGRCVNCGWPLNTTPADAEGAKRHAQKTLGPYLAAEGLSGQLLSKQAATVYDAAVNAIAALEAIGGQDAGR